jgi:hypothetical protein
VPLEFTRFVDENLPGTRCTVSLRSLPGVEAVASVYDVATERIYSNPWRTVRRSAVAVRQVEIKSVKGVYGGSRSWEMGYSHPVFRNALMLNPYGSSDDLWELESSVVTSLSGRVAGVRGVSGVRKSRASTGIYGFRANMESIPFQMAESKAGFSGMEGISIRESFSAALAFEPFLYPDEDGGITFSFDASDKLSTYVVSVFAHDREMNNTVVRREMTVTMPVKLSVIQPQYLYEGDVYVLNASVSSMSSADVSGDMMLEIYYGGTFEGQTPVARYMAEDLEIAAGGSASASFMIEVPSGVDTLGFKTVFAAGEFSDGMFVKVPVYPAGQVIREAHSAVLLSGESEEDLIRELRERFVNGSSMGAEYSSLSVLEMLEASLPLMVEAEGKDALSQSEAMYVNLLSAGLRRIDGEDFEACVEAARSAKEKLMACVNEDGGFAWLEGMKSSPVVTAAVLGRFAGLRERGLLGMLPSDSSGMLSNAVKYMDSVYFSDSDRPAWYGGLLLWQYLAVRAMYAEVPFDEAAARKAVGAREYREFKTSVKWFLVPGKGTAWTDGYVLGKVRMLSVLSDLMSSKAEIYDKHLQQCPEEERPYAREYSFSYYTGIRNILPTFYFKHNLARLEFELVPGVLEGPKKNVAVASIKVYSKYKADFVVAEKSHPSQLGLRFEDEYACFQLAESDGSPIPEDKYVVQTRSSSDAPVDATQVGGCLLVAPQNEPLEALVRLVERDVDGNFVADVENSVLISYDYNGNSNMFAAGNKYKVKFQIFGATIVSSTVALEKWNDGGKLDVDTEDDKPNI